MATAARRVAIPTVLLCVTAAAFCWPTQQRPLSTFERRLVGTWSWSLEPPDVHRGRSFTTLPPDRRYSHTFVTADGVRNQAGSGTWTLEERANRNVLKYEPDSPRLMNTSEVGFRPTHLVDLPGYVIPLSFTFDSEDRLTATGGKLAWERVASDEPGN